MARDIKLDPVTRDIELPIKYITGKEELKQSLETLLMTPKGTFLSFPGVGMDYTFLDTYFNSDELRLAVLETLKEDKRVLDVKNVQVYLDKNQMAHVVVNIQTTEGTIKFDKEMKTNALR